MSERRIEINEAIDAGNRALRSLQEAKSCLGTARGLGVWDILGGGFFSSLLKQSKVDDAQACLERAQSELRAFSKELEDVQMYGAVDVSFDGFAKAFDIFFDNMFVDILVQEQIKKAQSNVDSAIIKVQDALRRLYQMREEY